MTRAKTVVLAGFFVLTGLLLAKAAAADHPEQVINLEVRLPAEATLEVAGKMTQSRGKTRLFTSPPLLPGNYTYHLKASWQGKVAVRNVAVQAGEYMVVDFVPEDFKGTVVVKELPPDKEKPPVKEKPTVKLPLREGFVTLESDGRWWIFRAGSKDLAAFHKVGEPAIHVSRINAPPLKVTLRAPDLATLEEYLTAKPGFVTKFEDGRLWVFRKGAKELAMYLKDGELAQHVIRPGAGPRRMTLKAPDRTTIEDYLAAKD